jgi:fibronectin type 3 domain-containing protein
LAGDLALVRYFDTWNGGIIKSTDPASLVYHPPSGHLFIADSEISETRWFTGKNVFEVSLTGDRVVAEYATGNSEPTGIAYNEFDGYFYITNDDNRTISRYSADLSSALATIKTTDVDRALTDPEGITSDPSGNLYVVNGAGGGNGQWVATFDSNLQLQSKFPISDQVARDAEGIAYNRANQHLYIVSNRSRVICEYTLDGTLVENYDIGRFVPRPRAAQGLTFGPTSDPNDDPEAISLYIADGGVDNAADGRIYEARIGPAPTTPTTPTADAKRFDFGMWNSPVESGYTRVAENTTYSSTLGYGWQSGTTASRNRGIGSALEADFNFTPAGVFAVDLPNGDYQVTVTLGDRGPYVHDLMGVFLEGKQVGTVSTGAGQMVASTYSVRVADGQLTVLLKDLGGSNPSVCIAALTVTAADPTPIPDDPASTTVPVRPASLVATAVSSSQVHLSWQDNGGNEQGFRIQRKTGTGKWSLVATLAANATSYQDMGVSAGTTYNYRVQAYNAVGNSRFSAIASATTPRSQFTAYYDFGTARSPVESGYQRVNEATKYTAALGYGWQSGKVGSRDRGRKASLDRDFNFTSDGTFAVDLPNGRYRVDLVLGDRGPYVHEQMGVYAEGVLNDTVTTLAKQTMRRSIAVDVRDGQLTLRFKDLGGANPSVVIDAIDIALLELFHA